MTLTQGVFSVLLVGCLASGLAACEQSAAGSCSTAEDVAAKLTTLVDDLSVAQSKDQLEAMLVGDRGTVIQVEFYTGSGTANGTGVAKDNKGHVFKVLF